MLENITNALSNIVIQTQAHLHLLFLLLGALLVIHILNSISHYRLLALGIYPRKMIGLPGIIFAPFLHANFNHLFFNAIPLFVLLDFMMIFAGHRWIPASINIILISGALTWLFGRPAIHVGASAVITGYWSYLVFNMYEQGGITVIILGFICLYYFAGIFFGILPLRKGVSWEGHLFGLIAGVLTAWMQAHGIPFVF